MAQKDFWWQQNKKWQTPVIASNQGSSSSRGLWLGLVITLGFAAWVIFQDRQNLLEFWQSGEYSSMTSLLVILLPAILLLRLGSNTLGRITFGNTPLTLQSYPVPVGGQFSGVVEIQKNSGDRQFSAQLLLHKHTRNPRLSTDDEQRPDTITDLVWKLPVEVTRERAVLGIRLLLRAELANDLPESEPGYKDQHHSWSLLVNSDDGKFKRTWSLPVIKPLGHL